MCSRTEPVCTDDTLAGESPKRRPGYSCSVRFQAVDWHRCCCSCETAAADDDGASLYLLRSTLVDAGLSVFVRTSSEIRSFSDIILRCFCARVV